jgi:hypothetical protein
MKFLFGILLSALLISCGNSYDLSTYENLGEEVFNAIKDNDIDRMVHFVPTRDEISEILKKTQKDADAEVKSMLNQLEENVGAGGNDLINELKETHKNNPKNTEEEAQKYFDKLIKGNIPEQFPRIRTRLLKQEDGSKLSWNNAMYKNSYLQYMVFQGFKSGKILIEVECENELFYFTIEASETLDNQWKIADDINIYRGDSESIKAFIDNQGLQEQNND